MQNKRLLALMRSQNKAYDILYMEVIIGILPMVRGVLMCILKIPARWRYLYE